MGGKVGSVPASALLKGGLSTSEPFPGMGEPGPRTSIIESLSSSGPHEPKNGTLKSAMHMGMYDSLLSTNRSFKENMRTF